LEFADITRWLFRLTPYDILLLLKGALVTIALSAGAIGLGSVFGAVVGWIRSLHIVKRVRPLWWLTSIYVDTVRGTPLLLQVHFGLYRRHRHLGVVSGRLCVGGGAHRS
jgi:His/Glu/Gln/Arg/opine family amino acid ABC transporter permease subunit